MMNSAERATAILFPDRESAQASLQALEDAGYGRPWMAVTRPAEGAYADDTSGTSANAGGAADHGSEHDVAESSDGVFGAIGRFFSGEGNSLRRSLEDHGIDPDQAAEIDSMIGSHGAVIVVSDERAATLAQQSGGRIAGLTAGAGAAAYAGTTRPGGLDAGSRAGAYDAATDRATGFAESDPSLATAGSGAIGDYDRADRTRGRATDEDLRTLQLREERLRVDKERVSAGEATIGKRVVSEQTSVDVPVMHEELFIERRPVTTARAASGTIGDGETIRVPLSREEVRVDKTAVVREEVAVGQRRVDEVRHIDETLQREELDVNTTSTGRLGDDTRATTRDLEADPTRRNDL